MVSCEEGRARRCDGHTVGPYKVPHGFPMRCKVARGLDAHLGPSDTALKMEGGCGSPRWHSVLKQGLSSADSIVGQWALCLISLIHVLFVFLLTVRSPFFFCRSNSLECMLMVSGEGSLQPPALESLHLLCHY
jgi:hypothetical protein